MPKGEGATEANAAESGPISVFFAFLRLGLTSFGGPVAHLGYFRSEFVARRRWLDETGYADIVALCQFLPGPASSQVAVTLGLMRAGLAGGSIGLAALRSDAALAPAPLPLRPDRALGIAALVAFVVLLLLLPLAAAGSGDHGVDLFARFYRAGALVFGGGHVVLPHLQQAVVPQGFVGEDAFLAGYGAAQAVPGPLFTFAAYLGTVMHQAPNGWAGALLCLCAIYLPSFLLLVGILPFWEALRQRASVQAALRGINATVVGLLLAALYSPVWTSAIFTPADFALAATALLLLTAWRMPPWLVVLLGAGAAQALGG